MVLDDEQPSVDLAELADVIQMPDTSSSSIGNVGRIVVTRLEELGKLEPNIGESPEIGYSFGKAGD